MTIPDFESLMLPVLRKAADGPVHIRRLVEDISDELRLTPEERTELVPSGRGRLISNRAQWTWWRSIISRGQEAAIV